MKISTLKPALIALAILFAPVVIFAHCDSLDGPVILDAKAALHKGDVTPILKWVAKNDEGEIKEAFKKTLAVSSKGSDVKEMAEMYFFETLVRIHRAGEGFPYTGLKKSVTEAGPAVLAADRALETGDAKELGEMLSHTVEKGVKKRFEKAMELKKHSGESVEKGREFVAAYVDYVHYAEGIHMMAEKGAGHGHGGEEMQGGKEMHESAAGHDENDGDERRRLHEEEREEKHK